MALSIGTQAPDFSLKTKTAAGLEDVKLSTYAGDKNVVLLFFPAAFTGTCTSEMCDISATMNAYDRLNAKVIGISVDTPFAQEAWAQQQGINFTLASDLNKQTAIAYDVLLEDLVGIGSSAKRAAFVIDKAGVIQYAEATPTPADLPDFKAVQAKLAELS